MRLAPGLIMPGGVSVAARGGGDAYAAFLANIAARSPTLFNMTNSIPIANNDIYRVQMSMAAEGAMIGSPWTGSSDSLVGFDMSTLARTVRHGLPSGAVMDSLKVAGSIILVRTNLLLADTELFGQDRNGYLSGSGEAAFAGHCQEITYFDPLTNLAQTMSPVFGSGPTLYVV